MKVLMLHGFLGDRSDWTDFITAAGVALPDLDCDAPDLPGHGHDPRPSPDDFAGWVDWVRERLDAAGEPVHLVGYSMGGRLALAAAVAEADAGSDRVASLAVLAASPGIVDATARAERRRVDAERADRLQRDGLTAFLEQWYGMPLFQPAIELVGLELLVARRSRGQAHALAAALITAGAGMMPDLRPRLERLAIPVLAIAGDRDSRYMNLEQDIAALAPAGQFAVVPGAGHALLVEAPERCAAFWRAFVLSANLVEGASP
jgi:2-succinyl-6-hydroxy-2,4-cyclohexadiene-1-carboxylate synthase